MEESVAGAVCRAAEWAIPRTEVRCTPPLPSASTCADRLRPRNSPRPTWIAVVISYGFYELFATGMFWRVYYLGRHQDGWAGVRSYNGLALFIVSSSSSSQTRRAAS